MPTFPGIKVLTLGPVHKNIGGTINKAKVTIPVSRITGEPPTIYMRTDTNDWEECINGSEHTFVNTGNELYVRLAGSGCVLSTRGTAGEITPCILVKVTDWS